MKSLAIEFEKAVRILVKYLPVSDSDSRKPILFHDVRVGTYLYENGYAREVVLAGVLHDTIEWSEITENMLRENFGEKVAILVLANTKDSSIDKIKRNEELIKRCVDNGEEALIIKTADTIDSFRWYSKQSNQEQLVGHCLVIAGLILKYKPAEFEDKIFNELSVWVKKINK